VDLLDLETGDREIFMDELGTLNLPPDIVLQMGGSGSYRVEELKTGKLALVNVDTTTHEVVDTVLRRVDDCPACGFTYSEEEMLLCPECGSSRPKVSA